MSKPAKYRVYFTDSTELETSYCNLRVSVNGQFLYEDDPSNFGRGTIRTFVMTNVKYWEPIE
jgi:hypothetical protein